MRRSICAVGVCQRPHLCAAVRAVGRARERAGHRIAQLAEREDGDAAPQRVEPPDMLVQARDGDAEARREGRERQAVEADLVGEVGARATTIDGVRPALGMGRAAADEPEDGRGHDLGYSRAGSGPPGHHHDSGSEPVGNEGSLGSGIREIRVAFAHHDETPGGDLAETRLDGAWLVRVVATNARQ